ncbi:MAG: HAD family hydrolase [Clostridia bacterium]|nr:HAD family hydrolase [Clostridia bacterium]
MLQAVFFDLDGTLLPMDNDYFIQVYFKLLAKAAAQWGYTNTDKLIQAVWTGVKAMIGNQGLCTNEEAFWNSFCALMGPDCKKDLPLFDRFYETDFHQAKEVTFPAPLARKAVETARQKAQKIVLASNPVFPIQGTRTRMSWIGLTPEDFDHVTHYGNSRFCKPNPAYYRDLLDRFGLDASQCLMIGNDAHEDIEAAAELGIKGYWLTDYAINRKDLTLTCPQGNYEELVTFLESL